ncbi:adenosylcobinamide-GDP ribazoletransferase [Thermus thermamylovorans]|uniref:Adenosylcobinamide-GDP ribazoletransferase n=1 Tax=Thermus thermamylovorans TaxID=2509362 RepID=A0A4Q9B4U4_9DEIN|nr:adenosylcobinamide-GDP ribazoletransferase [Thermus thermamylovorans]TBH20831.1 adenosylcobinamide-GDP ribazoletransferase [Thermus thermamylovorans]
MWRTLRLALALLTVFPLAPKEARPEEFRQTTPFFPLAGYALGLPLALLAILPLPEGLFAALALALLLGLTGFLHLDGLLDVADALLGARPREERLRLLKDPHLGAFAFGVGGLYLLLLWQALALAREPLFLLLLPGFARFAILLFLHRYPLLGPGMAGLVRGGPWAWGLLFAWPFPALYPLPALLVLLAAWGVAHLAARRLGGLNGDVLGAMIALSELAGLLGYALWKAPGG